MDIVKRKPGDLDAHHEFVLAYIRIGDGKDGLMLWLLEFARRDLSRTSGGDWMNLSHELKVFISNIKRSFVENKSKKGIEFDQDKLVLEINSDLLSQQIIRNFQTYVIGALNKIILGEKVSFEIKALTVSLVPAKLDWVQPDRYPAWRMQLISSDSESILLFILSNLLDKYVLLIRRCPQCSIIFLAERKNQSYCSKTHQNYRAVHKYRESKGLITGRKRGRPRKQDTLKKEGGS